MSSVELEISTPHPSTYGAWTVRGAGVELRRYALPPPDARFSGVPALQADVLVPDCLRNTLPISANVAGRLGRTAGTGAFVGCSAANGTGVPHRNLFNANGRGYPDISALAHSYLVDFTASSYEYLNVDGTSASTPVIAALVGRINAHLIRKLRAVCLRKLLKQEIGFFDDEANSAGDLAEFLASKVTLVQSACGEKLQIGMGSFSTLVAGTILMFVLGDWRVTLVTFATFPLMAFAMAAEMEQAVGEQAVSEDPDAQKEKSAGALVYEVVLGIRTVASFGAEERFYRVETGRMSINSHGRNKWEALPDASQSMALVTDISGVEEEIQELLRRPAG